MGSPIAMVQHADFQFSVSQFVLKVGVGSREARYGPLLEIKSIIGSDHQSITSEYHAFAFNRNAHVNSDVQVSNMLLIRDNPHVMA